ncbi:hypothetical protein JY572_32170 [Myxococcus landrumensis]|uniref:Outer membrane protein beta-barrel domain-containing protein n=2 Tax=Myxococcus landrumensis TaxID=2813577 RepID=A0ABX7N9D6_9BACT|nr:hypothetical protein JY572_32170 [Myxococcus landrumus]
MGMRLAFVAVMCLGFWGTGCVSVSHVQTADTLGQGKFQFAMEPGLGGAGVVSGEGVEGFYYPHIDLAMRYGVSDRVDLGVRIGSSLAELQSKFLLTHPDNPDLAISLAPSVMGLFVGTDEDAVVGSYVNVAMPLLVGFKTSGGSEFVLGPRVSYTRIGAGGGGESAAVNLLNVGTSVGYAIRVTEGFRLMPEVGFSVPVVGTFHSRDSDSELASGFNGGFVQFKLGFLFGRGRSIQRPSQDAFTDTSDVDI